MGDNPFTWSEQTAARAEAVGFVVTRTKEGYRVLGPEGKTQGWHRTITPAAKRKVMTALNSWGLAEREAKIAAREERERAAVLAADRKANEARITETVKAAKKTSRPAYKAAGEYAIHDDESWPLRKHPSPACRLMFITPMLAAKMLTFNSANRKLRRRHTDNLAEDMADSRFVLTHQGVAFDTDGILLDGQHRLQAMVDSNTSLPMFVFVGIDPAARAFIDVHARRSNSDVLTMNGISIPSVANVVALIRTVYVYKAEPTGQRWGATRIDSQRILEAYQADPEGYATAVREANAARNARGGYTSSALGGVIYIARTRGASEDDIDEFYRGYKTGVDLSHQHPLLALRRQAEANAETKGHHVKPKLQFGQVLMAWNAFQEGRKITTVRTHRLDDPFPPFSIRKK